MKTMKYQEYLDEAIGRFGPDAWKWKFVCPMCKTEQTGNDLLAAGVPREKVTDYIGYSCVGRFKADTESGLNNPEPGNGCDWTLGGLFKLHTIEIEDEEGVKHPRFELAPAPEPEPSEVA